MTTIASLLDTYRLSRFYTDLKPNSKRHYDYMMSGLAIVSREAKSLTTTDADALYDDLRAVHGHYRASHTIKVLRRVWQFGQRRDLVAINPFSKMSLTAIEPRTTLWTDSQVLTYFESSIALQTPSMGLLAYLCYDLCQRPGDIRQLNWEQFDGSIIRLVQEKTASLVEIPISGRIKSLLTPRWESGPIVIAEGTQKPYSESLMSKRHNRIREHAKLPYDLQLRDLRRSGATAMGSSGATEDEIMSVTGHRSRQVLNTYVKRNVDMARNAMEKRFGAE